MAISSQEASPLLKHSLPFGRVIGLNVFQDLSDAKAIELALPMLRDPSPIVRKRAVFFFQVVSGEDLPADDPAKWEHWWATHKDTYQPPKPPPPPR